MRLGSVGLVVSAINTGVEATSAALTHAELEVLRLQLHNAPNIDLTDDEDATAVEDMMPEGCVIEKWSVGLW